MSISGPMSFLGVGISGTRSLLGGVCQGGGYIWGWLCKRVCLEWVDMSGGWVLTPPGMGPQGVLTPSPRHGIQWDMVGKRTVRILFECFLVVDIYEKLL